MTNTLNRRETLFLGCFYVYQTIFHCNYPLNFLTKYHNIIIIDISQNTLLWSCSFPLKYFQNIRLRQLFVATPLKLLLLLISWNLIVTCSIVWNSTRNLCRLFNHFMLHWSSNKSCILIKVQFLMVLKESFITFSTFRGTEIRHTFLKQNLTVIILQNKSNMKFYNE